MTNPAQTVTITLSKIEFNKPLDDAVFAKPGVK
jgi:outer membrane lipoprotein-sorting protein